MTKPRFAFMIGGLSSAILAVLVPTGLHRSGLRFNDSKSMPLGLYRIVPRPSPYAGLCLPSDIMHSARQAGLSLERGECPDGLQPVLKALYWATPAAPVVLNQDGFTVAGKRLANTRPKAASRVGKPLTHYPFGTFTQGVFAISDFHPDSFDSRYFGPVPASSVRFYVEPVFVF
jgi:conjugative transfer signal peptidase TraF